MRDEYDFSDAKRAKDVPHLAQLQTEARDKTMITLMLDNDVLNTFRIMAKDEGLEYKHCKDGYPSSRDTFQTT